ncbi:hypothetical protein BKA93DRAFT_830185 [Sparassis latifolia]
MSKMSVWPVQGRLRTPKMLFLRPLQITKIPSNFSPSFMREVLQLAMHKAAMSLSESKQASSGFEDIDIDVPHAVLADIIQVYFDPAAGEQAVTIPQGVFQVNGRDMMIILVPRESKTTTLYAQPVPNHTISPISRSLPHHVDEEQHQLTLQAYSQLPQQEFLIPHQSCTDRSDGKLEASREGTPESQSMYSEMCAPSEEGDGYASLDVQTLSQPRPCTPETQDVMARIRAYVSSTTPVPSPAHTAFTTVPSSSPYSVLTLPSDLRKQCRSRETPSPSSPCALERLPPITLCPRLIAPDFEAIPRLVTPSTHVPLLPRLFPPSSGSPESRVAYEAAARACYPDLDPPSSKYWDYISFSQEVGYRDYVYDVDHSGAAEIGPLLDEPATFIPAYLEPGAFPEMVLEPVELEMLEHGTLTESNMFLDAPFLGDGIQDPAVLPAYIDHYTRLNAATAASSHPLTSHVAHSNPRTEELPAPETSMLQLVDTMMAALGSDEALEADDEEPPSLGPLPTSVNDDDGVDAQDDDTLDETLDAGESPDQDPPGVNDVSTVPVDVQQPLPVDGWDALMTGHDRQVPDPFHAEFKAHGVSPSDLRAIPPYLMCIHAVVSWTHLNFRLPVVAANALLWCFAVVLLLVAPGTSLPFVTLKSANRVLGLDVQFQTLAICPGCKDVYPSTPDTPECCIQCGSQLFKPNKTTRGNKRDARVPIIRYPYLSISQQLESVLSIEGTEELLDEWRKVPRRDGVYQDIFDGKIAKTLRGPDNKVFFANDGRRVRVALLAVVCDKPAAHKIGGFGGHSHTYLCTRDWITKHDIGTPKAFERNAYKSCTDKEQRELGERYRALKTEKARADFVRQHATRYTELSRLPYFDLVHQIVIDPMHNLFLGLTKTHFYHIWVQKDILRENHELRVLHEMLQDVVFTTKLDREITEGYRYARGGSLTADQWKLLVITQGPLIIPQLWRTCLPANPRAFLQDRVARIAAEEQKLAEDRKKAAEERAHKKATKDAAKATGSTKKMKTTQVLGMTEGPTQGAPSSTAAVSPVNGTNSTCPVINNSAVANKVKGAQLHPDDPANFLKLSEALGILTGDILFEADLPAADQLLREYSTELIRLYGKSSIKPNHHYSIHTTECVHDFGPLHDFWSFLYERLNKVLKSYNTNNHGDGELETTFFAEFHRTTASARVVNLMAHDAAGGLHIQQLGQMMLKATQNERGTVAGLAAWAKEVDDDSSNAHPSPALYSMSASSELQSMTTNTYRLLLMHLTKSYPDWHLHSHIGRPQFTDSQPMIDNAIFFDHVVKGGQRYYASMKSGSHHSSLIEVYRRTSDNCQTVDCGELLEIFQFQQNSRVPPMWFGRIRWFKPWEGDREPIWDRL